MNIDNSFQHQRRRGATLALTLIMLSTMLGLAALVVDVGRLYNTRSTLQNAVDAAALAATLDLGEVDYAQSMITANESVDSMLSMNHIWGPKAATSYELVFGRTQTSMDGSGLVFIADAIPPNALEVTAHYDMQYTFGQLMGFQESRVNASATAAIVARDVMFVFDTSCTMGDLTSTSELEDDLASLGIDVNGNQVTICHYPPGNPGMAQTISIPSSAVSAHLAHGDTLDSCVDGFVDCDGIGGSDSEDDNEDEGDSDGGGGDDGHGHGHGDSDGGGHGHGDSDGGGHGHGDSD